MSVSEKIPSYFIKRVWQSILYPLTYLLNSSLSANIVPRQWKRSLITPVFKKGNRKLPTNYRPIAQTSSFCRILESILYLKIFTHIKNNSIISKNQFGFIPDKSSSSQLLVCMEKWISSFCENKCTLVAYTDISKAFDTVNHRKLLSVLTSIKLPLPLISWIRNYLSDRDQIILVNSVSSSTLPVHSGIPQGSILGPLLFLIYMNDIIISLENSDTISNFILFADDTKIFGTDPVKLQYSLNNFNLRLQKFQLNLSAHKCALFRSVNNLFHL